MMVTTLVMKNRGIIPCKLSSAVNIRNFSLDSTVQKGDIGPPQGPPRWRPTNILDQWVERDVVPISLRQLSVFGRKLTEGRLIQSANYVREELPTRIAHRLRKMQLLPYSALSNQHLSHVYELYYAAFERLRKVPEIRSLPDNADFCHIINSTLNEHLSVIPRLAMGILEIQKFDFISGEECDRFISSMLKSRISRRVIAQQHLALTETYTSGRHSLTDRNSPVVSDDGYVGEILPKCNVKEIIDRCARNTIDLMLRAHGPDVVVPEIKLQGHMDATCLYIPSHLEYIIGELLRNSVQATLEQSSSSPPGSAVPPIEVLICQSPEHIMLRVSDQGGGVEPDILPYIWSFAKGPRRKRRLQNLGQVPKLGATKHDVKTPSSPGTGGDGSTIGPDVKFMSSLASLSSRPPGLKLGIGLPISRIYAEYWAGSLEIHNLEGYGCDVFLRVNRLGNRNEVLSTRANIDAV